jgi:outer membrane protein TolC
MPRTVRFLCLLLLSALAVSAADRPVSRPGLLRLTHESAMQMALAKNFSIEVASFQPQVSSQRQRSAEGRFDPAFIATYRYSDNARQDLFLDSQLHLSQSVISRNTEWSAGFGGLTPWGLRYDLGIGNETVTGTSNFWRELSTSSVNGTLVQPLLRGFGPAANLSEVRVARNNVKVSEWALRNRIIDILTQTNFVYNDLHSAMEAVKVAERSRELALRLLSDNEARVKIGVKSPLDVTEARAAAAARVEEVILARQAVRTNENILKQLVTRDLEAMLDIAVEIAPPPSPVFVSNVPAGIQEALDLRPDYRQALLELQNRNVVLAFRKNETLPRFDLTGSLEMLGFDNDLGSSIKRVAGRDQTIWSVGAIVSIPIPNREARGSEAAARLEVAQQMVRLKEIEQQIIVDVDNASGDVIAARERIVSTDEARRLAQESLDAGEERLKAGVSTTFEVLELQKKLSENEAAEIRARADYNKAVSEYYRQTGTSLRVYSVKVQ